MAGVAWLPDICFEQRGTRSEPRVTHYTFYWIICTAHRGSLGHDNAIGVRQEGKERRKQTDSADDATPFSKSTSNNMFLKQAGKTQQASNTKLQPWVEK